MGRSVMQIQDLIQYPHLIDAAPQIASDIALATYLHTWTEVDLPLTWPDNIGSPRSVTGKLSFDQTLFDRLSTTGFFSVTEMDKCYEYLSLFALLRVASRARAVLLSVHTID
jgi:hypothetical protein